VATQRDRVEEERIRDLKRSVAWSLNSKVFVSTVVLRFVLVLCFAILLLLLSTMSVVHLLS